MKEMLDLLLDEIPLQGYCTCSESKNKDFFS